MIGILFKRHWAQVLIAAALAVGLMVVSVPASAAAQQSGQALLRSAENGRSCAKFSGRDFGQMGEVVMGRMAGSPAVHDAMEVQMRRMMGPGAERRVHAFLGRRFSGCGGALPADFGPMMRTVGMGMMIGGSGSGIMGSGVGRGGSYPNYGHGPNSVMGGYNGAHHHNDGIGAMSVLLIAIAVLLALIAAMSIRRARSHTPSGD